MTSRLPSFYENGAPVVYRAVNLIDGGVYIGATMRSMAHRAAEHASAAVTGKSRTAFVRAIAEHGADMFRYSILRRCASLDEARQEEARLIELLKPSYNSVRGGGGARPENFTADSRAKIGSASRQRGGKVGRRIAERTRARLREIGLSQRDQWAMRSHLGPAASAKQVVCLDDGLVFESASAAARHYGTARSALIELCNGDPRRKTVAGRRFAYVGGV